MRSLLDKEQKDALRKLNRELKQWDTLGYRPNEVRRVENLLEDLYSWMGKKPKENDKFNLRVKYNQDQLDELLDIAESVDTDDIDFKKFKNKFKKAKGKHDLNTLEEYAKFVDKKTKFMDNALASSVLSYYEYEKLMIRATSKKYTQEDLMKMIKKKYDKDGSTGDALYTYIYKKLGRKKRRK